MTCAGLCEVESFASNSVSLHGPSASVPCPLTKTETKAIHPEVTGEHESATIQCGQATGYTVEDALDIDRHDIVPAFRLREVVVWSPPGDARVVYEDVQLRFSPFEFGDEPVAACFILYAR